MPQDPPTNRPALASLGRKIAGARIARSMSQRKLGELAMVARSTISQIERGRFIPSADIVRDLAGALDLDFGELMNLRGAALSERQRQAAKPSTQIIEAVDIPSEEAFGDVSVEVLAERSENSKKNLERAYSAVFISYRRADEPAFAGRIYDRIEAKFGRDRVFMDVDTLELGVDFPAELEKALELCKVMIVVIGQAWASAEAYGQPRLRDPDDFVRLEIETALRRNIRVIPVLVDDADMPRRSDLPESMHKLLRRNGLPMSNARFGADAARLLTAIAGIVDPPADEEGVIVPRPAPASQRMYVRDVFNRVSQLARAAIGADLVVLENMNRGSADDVMSVYAPVSDLNRKFAVRVAWSEEQGFLQKQVAGAKGLMDGTGLPGLIVSRSRLNEAALRNLNFDGSETHIQWVMWRYDGDDEALKLALRRVTGSG